MPYSNTANTHQTNAVMNKKGNPIAKKVIPLKVCGLIQLLKQLIKNIKKKKKPEKANAFLKYLNNGWLTKFIIILGRWLFLEKPFPRLLKTHIRVDLFYLRYRLIVVE